MWTNRHEVHSEDAHVIFIRLAPAHGETYLLEGSQVEGEEDDECWLSFSKTAGEAVVRVWDYGWIAPELMTRIEAFCVAQPPELIRQDQIDGLIERFKMEELL